MRFARLSLWPDCVREGDSDRLKSLLAVNTGGQTSWPDLRATMEFLRDNGAGDREVTCRDWSAIPLYTEMNIEPSTRFVFTGARVGYFPSFKELIVDEMLRSPQRFIVVDLYMVKGLRFDSRRPVTVPRQTLFSLLARQYLSVRPLYGSGAGPARKQPGPGQADAGARVGG